jgi:hypothetical protein
MISLPLPPPRSTIRSAILSTIKRLRPTQRIIFARWEAIKLFTTANWSASRPDFIFVRNGVLVRDFLSCSLLRFAPAGPLQADLATGKTSRCNWSGRRKTQRENADLSLRTGNTVFRVESFQMRAECIINSISACFSCLLLQGQF